MDPETAGVSGIEWAANEEAPHDDMDIFEWAFRHSVVPNSITSPTGEARVNDAFCEMLGYTLDELGDETTWMRLTHPDDVAETQRQIDALISGEQAAAHYEKRYLRKDGGIVWAEVHSSLRRDADGEPLYLATTMIDITERKAIEERIRRLNRIYAILYGINQAIVRIRQPQALFDEACRVIVEDGGFVAAWVGLVDPADNRVRVAAQGGATKGYFDDIEIIVGHETLGRGPTGRSISERRHMFSQDIEHDPAMTPWREDALRQGYRSSASFPLVVNDAVVGAFTMYADEPGFFDEGQIGLLDELAGDISFAMEFIQKEDQRERAEEALRESETSLKEAQRLAGIGSWDWNTDTDTITWSEEYYRIYGIDPTQPPPRYEDHLKAYTPESAALLDAAVQMNIQTGEPYEIDLELARTGGPPRWITARSETKRDSQGRIIGLRGTAQDITERKHAEEALKGTAARLNDAQRIAHLGSWELDVANNVLVWSDEIYRMFEIDPTEFGASYEAFLNAIHPEDREAVDFAYTNSLETRTPYVIDHRLLFPDGRIKYVHEECETKYDEEGSPTQSTGTVQDITERKAAEQQHRTILRTAMDGFWLTDTHGHLLEVNDAYCRMSGYSEEELLDMRVSELEVFESTEEVAAHADRVVSEGSDRFETRHRRKDGSVFDVESSMRYQQETGRISAFQRDITERKLASERLAKALTAITEVVSLVSETRDPYTAGHQRRVSELSAAIAVQMGMSEDQVEEIRLAALIHDVGKISIPAEILSKPGKLSPVEFQLIKGHSEAGYKIIAGANMEGPFAEIVYEHHERCDGSGYPRGLAGDQLLPGTKVIMVADVVEAMASHRPYRAALGIEAALAEIESGAGSRYDADVARACASLFSEGAFAFSS